MFDLTRLSTKCTLHPMEQVDFQNKKPILAGTRVGFLLQILPLAGGAPSGVVLGAGTRPMMTISRTRRQAQYG